VTTAAAFTPGGGLPISVGYGLAALVCAASMLLPGLGIALGLGRRAGWDLAETLGASFAFGLAVVAGVTTAGHYLGFGLIASAVACGVVFVAAWVGGLLLGRGRPHPALGLEGLAFGLMAAIVAVIERPWFANASDTFYHLASVRSLLVLDRPAVTDPFYRTGITSLDPTTGVWQSMLAIVSRVTRLDVMWLWPGATAVGAAMTLLAFWVLCRRVGANRFGAGVGTGVFFVIGLMLDMRWFAYPNRMSLALVFLGLAAFAALLEKASAADVALAIAAGFAAISLHLASAAVIVLMAVFLGGLLVLDVATAGLRERRSRWHEVGALAATGGGLAALSLAVLLPKAGVIAGSSLVGASAAYITKQTQPVIGGFLIGGLSITGAARTLFGFGTVLGLLAAVAAFFENDRRALAAFGIAAFPAAMFLNPLAVTALFYRSQYLTWRIAILLPFAFYVGVAWGLSRWGRDGWWGKAAFSLAVVAVCAAAYAGATSLMSRFVPTGPSHDLVGFAVTRERDVRTRMGPEALARIAEAVGDTYPIVAGDLDSTYNLSGIMDVAVMAAPAKHAPFAIENTDGGQRRSETAMLLAPATPESMRREILGRRDVSFVVVGKPADLRGATRKALDAQPDLLSAVVRTPELTFYRVLR
jgi:hypothetical protein